MVERIEIKKSPTIKEKLAEFCKDLPVLIPDNNDRYPGIVKNINFKKNGSGQH
ncbi:hypothetical protein HYU94_01815 [Candidatus Daviesbacteria bacterium]|nr:hypothetical protein [Candidatus Daviesbacteria bacterium]